MNTIPKDYINKIYAGWLGKIIGIRHGSNIESWSYEAIEKVYGEVENYLFDFKNFAADDDSNGPMFFLRALEDYTHTSDITAEQIGLTWLNYAPFEHGFYWWGGYGKSTEHTAYLNLRNGIMAPRSGSIEQNGAAVAEQIGGQIFIDTWGLVVPGDFKLAAQYAEKAASVSHGGNGVYGGMFIAACISAAFIENDLMEILEDGLSVIPSDCEYTRITREIIKYHKNNPDNWRDCFKYIKDNFGYDRYPGACHIIPNSAVMILSLLYGNGNFSSTINICNMCGWDTDCNVGNVATIMGVWKGLEGIDFKWRKPINDFLACSSVIGSLNILDLPWCVYYIANLAYKIAGEEPPTEWKEILSGEAARFNFELPGSTHGFRLSADTGVSLNHLLENTTEYSHSGKGALKIAVKPLSSGNEVRVYNKTYYIPSDFNDSRYDPCFSPVLYPGQTIKAFVMVPACNSFKTAATIYVKDVNSGEYSESEGVNLIPGEWMELSYRIPSLNGACLEEAGVKFTVLETNNSGVWEIRNTMIAYIDDFDFCGVPDYNIDFSKERIEHWTKIHKEISQFTYLKGIWELDGGALSGSCSDFAEAYTGGYNWKDYSFEATMLPQLGDHHNINFRVQGAIRSYALGLSSSSKLILYKNDNGYKELSSIPFAWECGKEYTFKCETIGPNIKIYNNDKLLMEFTDNCKPYLTGQIGVSVLNGSHCHYKNFIVKGKE
ncbi:MAG TPA: ADP-ribosylglycohydrolase family protein [Ruminiclostridium sp.]